MKSRKRIELTKRDLEILQFIFERRVASHQQIEQRFFPNFHRSLAYQRLTKICDMGFLIKRITIIKNKGKVFYSLNDKSIKVIKEIFRYEITSPDYKSDSIHHDIGLVEVRKRLETMSMVVDYLPESVLQSCEDLIESQKFRAFSYLNSDAALVVDLKKAHCQVALEYEISCKKESRYIRKLSDYYLYGEVEAVFYVCGNARIEKLIRSADAIVGEKYPAKIFTCLEADFYNSSVKIPFRNRENLIFNFT